MNRRWRFPRGSGSVLVVPFGGIGVQLRTPLFGSLCRHAAGTRQSRSDAEPRQHVAIQYEPENDQCEQDEWR